MSKKKEDEVKRECKSCKAIYVERDDKIWNPACQLPVGMCSYDDFYLCADCKSHIINYLKTKLKGGV